MNEAIEWTAKSLTERFHPRRHPERGEKITMTPAEYEGFVRYMHDQCGGLRFEATGEPLLFGLPVVMAGPPRLRYHSQGHPVEAD